jgi:hypothetical protein
LTPPTDPGELRWTGSASDRTSPSVGYSRSSRRPMPLPSAGSSDDACLRTATSLDASHRFTDPRHWFQLLIYSAFVESRKDAPVHELPLFHMKDLQRIDASRLADGMSK